MAPDESPTATGAEAAGAPASTTPATDATDAGPAVAAGGSESTPESVTAASEHTGAAVTLSHTQVLVVFSGLMLGMLLAALDQTIVATALPTITGELGGLDHLSWVVTSYLLATTISTPLYGKLGDLYGRKRLFQVAIVVFLIGSMLCGLASSMWALIGFRAIQGIGGGGLMVLAQAIIADVVSPRERGRYQGYFGALFGVTSILGPLVGGAITDHLSWRWVFYVNVPIGVIALFVTSVVLPAGLKRGNPSIDFTGAVLLTAGVTSIVLATTWGGTEYPWSSATIIGLIAAAVVSFGLLMIVERRAAEPMLPLHLLRRRTVAIATSVSFIVGVAMFGAVSFLPLFLQVVTGASATNSGLLLLPLMLGLLAASILSGQIISHTGRYKIFPVAGTALAAVAMFLLSTMGPDTTRTTVGWYMVILGVGLGLTMATLILATQNEVPVSDLGAATSAVNFFRSMGGSIGVALFGALFNAGLTSRLGGLSGFSINADETSMTSMTPEQMRSLPDGQVDEVIGAFAGSLTDVFFYAAPAMMVAVFLAVLLREVPLRDSDGATVHDEAVPPLA